MRTCGTAPVVVGLLLLAAIKAEAAANFYLIAPPTDPTGAAGGSAVNLSAPLSRWERRGSYDTSTACFGELNAYRIAARSSAAVLEQGRAENARCVYANDPRLK